MTEQEEDAAMRALFATTETPGEGPAFVAAVVKRVAARREQMRLRVQVLTVTTATVGGLGALPYLGAIGQTLAGAWVKSLPLLPAMSAGTTALVLGLTATALAYLVAERA